MKDGLYQVTTPYMCCGFRIINGKVTDCAPMLRKKIDYWITKGVWISDGIYEEKKTE